MESCKNFNRELDINWLLTSKRHRGNSFLSLIFLLYYSSKLTLFLFHFISTTTIHKWEIFFLFVRQTDLYHAEIKKRRKKKVLGCSFWFFLEFFQRLENYLLVSLLMWWFPCAFKANFARPLATHQPSFVH